MDRFAIRSSSHLDDGVASSRRSRSADAKREAAVLKLVRRDPITLRQISETLGIAMTEGHRHLANLCHDRLIERWRVGGQIVYRAVSSLPRLRRTNRRRA